MSGSVPADVLALHQFLVGLLDLGPGLEVLDAGCGRGITVGLLLDACPGGRVCGIDVSSAAIGEVAARFEGAEFLVWDLELGLPYEDDQFDRVLSHNVIECLGDRSGFIEEMCRVLKPGGVMVLSHMDFDSQIYNSRRLKLTRRLVHLFADTKQAWMAHADGAMGRKLSGLVRGSRFAACEVLPYVLVNTSFEPGEYGFDRSADMVKMGREAGVLESELEDWVRDLSSLAESGEYFYSVNTYAVRAVK